MSRLSSVGAVVVVTVLVAGCQPGGSSSGDAPAAGPVAAAASGASAGDATAGVSAARVTVVPAPGAQRVRPDGGVRVRAESGRLTAVVVADAEGSDVPGAVDGDVGWRSDPGALRTGATYTVRATVRGEDGAAVTRTSTFSTLRPARTNRATLVPGDDWTVGVGMPVVVTFAQAVRNRAAVVRTLTVSSSPAVKGTWRWMNDHEVQYRPVDYWPSGAKVSVRAAFGGVETSPGVWGRRTVTTAFTVGARQISTVDVARHTMTVRRSGKIIRTVPVTTGMPGFLTRGGTKVIMSREAQVRMDAATTGTDPKDPNYYNILVRWALRLTYSGEFLHAAPWSVGSQGRANVSHGCTGMSTADAKWMYDHSQIGDVVVFAGSKRPLEWGNGYTVWNRTFSAWSSGV